MAALVSRDACTGQAIGEVPETPPEAVGAMLDEVDALSELFAREQGRPRTEAVTMELLASVGALRWVAAHAPRFLADERLRSGNQLPLRGKRSHLVRDPVGV